MVTAQERLRDAARAAGWLAEYEVRGFGWIADVLCTNGDTLVALEDQLVDTGDLVMRTARYHQSGIHAAWFTPKLRKRKIARLAEDISIFDADEIDAVVPYLLAQYREPRSRSIQSVSCCELCRCPISTVATYWCWNCWLRFTTPNSGCLVRPYKHLTAWNHAREQRELAFDTAAEGRRALMEGT